MSPSEVSNEILGWESPRKVRTTVRDTGGVHSIAAAAQRGRWAIRDSW